MYAFLWRPKWILSHLLVLVLIASMIAAMFWQISRLRERQEANALVARNSAQVPLSPDGFDAALRQSTIARLQYRRVESVGTYDTSAEVEIQSRTLDGAPGRWIATPFVPADGGTPILVVRGFVPFAMTDTTPPFDGAEPPAGQVTIVGWAQPTQTKGFFGSIDAPTGRLTAMARVDVARFSRQYGAVKPYWLQLSGQEPVTRQTLLSGIPLPVADEGPHRGYAGQGAIFTAIAILGYPLILRRAIKQHAIDGDRNDDDDGDDDDEADASPDPLLEPSDA